MSSSQVTSAMDVPIRGTAGARAKRSNELPRARRDRYDIAIAAIVVGAENGPRHDLGDRGATAIHN